MNNQQSGSAGRPLSHIVLIGNAVPRRCGLATFTTDTATSLRAAFPSLQVDHYAMDDGSGVDYAPDIRVIEAADESAYSRAARLIRQSGAQLLWIQHEYGIYGGPAGSYLLDLVDAVDIPVIATLHTILDNPGPEEERVILRLIDRCERLIVMAEQGRQTLLDRYGAPERKIELVPHGVPDRPFVDPDTLKPDFGYAGRKLILTFGLLAPDKGIETMIDAMPAIVADHPDAQYLVLGATHPNLKRTQGESYRDQLIAQARQRGVADHVDFIDAFVELDELLDYLQAADVYVTPYLNEGQITSGTLSYSVAVGKPVVSTPYVHAREILSADHGILVGFEDNAGFAREVGELLADDGKRRALAERAYALGRNMIWSRSATRAFGIMMSVVGEPALGRHAALLKPLMQPDPAVVFRMSDDTGVFQHGVFTVANRDHGYCIDDNARALLFISRLRETDHAEIDRFTMIYAAFVNHAWNAEKGVFRNFMGYDRRWLEEVGSEDSNGRALWALGVVAQCNPLEKHRNWARWLYDETLPHLESVESPRALAFAMLGAAAMLDADPNHRRSRDLLGNGGELLLRLLAASRRPDWLWFETMLAYDNARLSEALLRAGDALGRDDFVATGLETLEWILGRQRAPQGHFRPIGSDGFGMEFRTMPFDQQPLEAQATIDACAAAWKATRATRWIDAAHKVYRWFLGANDLGLPLADGKDGGCHDGLTPVGVNANQGAESILAFQLANCAMAELIEQSDQPALASPVAA